MSSKHKILKNFLIHKNNNSGNLMARYLINYILNFLFES